MLFASPSRAAHVPADDLPELLELKALIAAGGSLVQVRELCHIELRGRRFPVLAVLLGNPNADAAVGYVGGVHGLERIGAQVVLAHLRSLVMRLQWDELLRRQLEAMRLVFLPIVNPAGLWQGTRANGNGVDLMRNAPVDAQDSVPLLIGGQRLSAGLPWYRGPAGAPLQAESQALCEFVDSELTNRRFSMAIDCHSGFGTRDRLWFPYAHTRRPIAHLPELHAFKRIFDRAQPQHRYIMEPQSRQYLAHGDLWDHLHLRSTTQTPGRVFLPLTLEMGSWLWVKKNPRQLFTRQGIFNPLIAHRQQRVLRHHLMLFDFMARAAMSHARWLPVGAERDAAQRDAMAHWYAA